MDRETAKAINEVSKKVNDIAQRLDNYLNARCDENKENIEQVVTDNADLLYEISMIQLEMQGDD